tara:strand:+ start:1112 stop:1333 length:222 start_codon:yes stop_codon:yes gene_type:complete
MKAYWKERFKIYWMAQAFILFGLLFTAFITFVSGTFNNDTTAEAFLWVQGFWHVLFVCFLFTDFIKLFIKNMK